MRNHWTPVGAPVISNLFVADLNGIIVDTISNIQIVFEFNLLNVGIFQKKWSLQSQPTSNSYGIKTINRIRNNVDAKEAILK